MGGRVQRQLTFLCLGKQGLLPPCTSGKTGIEEQGGGGEAMSPCFLLISLRSWSAEPQGAGCTLHAGEPWKDGVQVAEENRNGIREGLCLQ